MDAVEVVNRLVLEQFVRDAYEFAAVAHAGHLRKGSHAPYIIHPLAVMNLLIDVGIRDSAMLQAALLHDVVENTTCTIEDIDYRFGPVVAGLVAELTRPKDTHDSAVAFGQYLAGLSYRARFIKLADRIDNVRALLAIHDPAAVQGYLDETRSLFLPGWAEQTHAEMAGMLQVAVERAARGLGTH